MTALLYRSLVCFLNCASIGLISFGSLPRAASSTASLCPNQLSGVIEAIMNRPGLARSRIGVVIQPLGSRQTLYAHDAQRYFVPASNVKLLTTAAALRKLGPTYRIRTSIYGSYSPTGWRLRVVGRGDPSFSDAQLKNLAQQLKRRGVQRVAQLTIDDSYFDSELMNADWAVGDVQAGYGAPINSLILNENALGLKLIPQKIGQPLRVEWEKPAEGARWQVQNRSTTVNGQGNEFVDVGRDLRLPTLKVFGQLREGAEPESVAISVPDPVENFQRQFQQALVAEKITVDRAEILQTQQPLSGIEIARIESPPLSELVKEANQNSNNLYVESILRTIGANAPTAPGRTVLERGIATVNTVLSALGVDATAISLVDGSGLARQNWVTPAAIVQTLQLMAQQPESKLYRESLPIAGVSGTLQSRFQTSPAKGIVQAKTGTLTGAIALSGYANPPNYPPVVFSILINQSPDSAASQRSAIDEMVGLIVQLRSCQ